MNLVVPDYYPAFQCTASNCRHTCCRKWEIDIDQETMTYYNSLPGAFGKELRKAVEDGHFRLQPGTENCAMLTDEGLCRVIMTLGQEHLCQICADHPRFRNFYSDRTEIGLGLCCEAAGELILKREAPMRLLETAPETPEEEELLFYQTRQRILDVAQNRQKPVEERTQEVLALCGMTLPEKSWEQWAKVYRSLERLEPAWDAELDRLTGKAAPLTDPRWETAFEQLFVYFLYRHLPGALADGDFEGRAAFCVLSYRVLRRLCRCHENADLDTLVELARQYSQEVEYSEENLCVLLDLMDGLAS